MSAVLDRQPELDLGAPVADPLLEAYTEAGYYRRGISLEKALASPHLRLALELHAKAIARRRAAALKPR